MNQETTNTSAVEQAVHPMMQSRRIISSKELDMHNLHAIEAVAMSFALVLSVTAGTLFSTFTLGV